MEMLESIQDLLKLLRDLIIVQHVMSMELYIQIQVVYIDMQLEMHI